MEGRPTNEEPGRGPGPRDGYSSLAARKRAFLILDRERASLKARLRAWWHPAGRYEDLCLITMLTRLERDWLTQPTPRLRGSDRQGDGEIMGRGIAEWAGQWRLAPMTRLDADARRFERALGRLGKWLSAPAVAGAERSARERLERISSELEERDRGRAVVPVVATDGHGEKARMISARSRIRMAAAFGVLAAAAVGVLVASHTRSGPGASALAPSGVPNRPALLGVGTGGRRAAGGSRAGDAAYRSVRQGRHPHDRGRPQATPHRTHAKTTVVSTPVAPAPQAAPPPEWAPAPVSAEPAPASEPASAPQAPDLPGSPAPSKAESAGGGGSCPPEFGYEC